MAAALLSIPLGSAAAEVEVWETMLEDRYPATVTAAVQQCHDKGLSTRVCDQFQIMLQTDQCQSSMVRDGAHYRVSDTSFKRKAFGGDTPALVCDVFDGGKVHQIHWFTGFSGACNNVEPLAVIEEDPVRQSSFGGPTIRTDRPGLLIERPTVYKCNGCVLVPGGIVQLPDRVRIESAPGGQLVPPHVRN